MMTRKHLALIACALAVLMLIAVFICECVTAAGYGSQVHLTAAKRWDSDGSLPYRQVSVYVSGSRAISVSSVETIRENIDKALKTASLEAKNKDAKLWYDAWSTDQGEVSVKGDKTQNVTALATAVGGDFFLAHPMKLLSGNYIRPDDLMQDRVVIDTLLAWHTFGSSDVAGRELNVDGKIYLIAGVIEPAKDKITETAYGEKPRIYLPFADSSAAAYLDAYSDSNYDEDSAGNSGMKIECYEAILPNPVRGFAEKTLREALNSREDMKMVNQTERSSLTKRWETLKHLRESVVCSDGIVYPWWENASRIRDFSAAELLRTEILLLILPLLCLLVLIWKGYRAIEHLIDEKREQSKRKYRTIERDPYSV